MDYGRIVDVVANGFKRIEELDPQARILRGFRWSIQFDEYSCGMYAVYGILRYYGKSISTTRLEKQLRTNGNGTDLAHIKRVLRHHGLLCRTNAHANIQSLRRAIDSGCPALISTYEGEHWCVVYGYARGVIYVADSSLRMNSSCRIQMREFLAQWDKWMLVVDSNTVG
jgi:ABC-type bacteriocin/lantibiotic exporter with double-glycine peptidase domain